MKRLLIVLMPLALAGCVTEKPPVLPMALAPADTAQAACLQMPDTLAFGDCDQAGALSTIQE